MFTQLHCGGRALPVLFFVALPATGAVHLRAQAGAPAVQDTSAKASAFEVVSIKPANPDEHSSGWKDLPDGLDFTNGSLVWLIYDAYGISSDDQISGLPEWVKTDRYNVSARVDEHTVEAWKKLSEQDRHKQQQLMLQAVFADRCRLKLRREIKELPVYDLVVAKGGPKMKEAPADEKNSVSLTTTSAFSPTGLGIEYTIDDSSRAVTALGLAQYLPHYAGRIVVDKTGLGDKRFDFELKWSSSQEAPADSGGTAPSLFKAIEELGLKLEPAKEPVDTFVVEHIERPSTN